MILIGNTHLTLFDMNSVTTLKNFMKPSDIIVRFGANEMIEKVAYHLGRNDEEPNVALAVALCNTKDLEGIKEIVNGLNNEKI